MQDARSVGGEWVTAPRDRLILLVVTLVALAPVYGPLFTDPFRFYPDLANGYVLHELARPGSFKGDLFHDMALRFGAPPGYLGPLWVLAQVFPLLRALELQGLILSAVVVQLAFGLRRTPAARWPTAMAALALVVVMDSMHGGFPRAWGLTLTAALILLLSRQLVVASALLSAASIFFYPMVFPPAALATGCAALWRRVRTRAPRRELAIVGGVLIAGLLVALWRSAALADLAGAPCTPASCADMPELFTAGNYTFSAYRGRWLVNSLLNLGEHPPGYPWVIGLLLPVAAVEVLRSWRKPHAASWVLAAGLVAFPIITISNATTPLPTGYASRALVFTLPLAAAAGWGAAVARARSFDALRQAWVRTLLWLILSALPPGLALLSFDIDHISDDHRRLAPALEAIRSLPEDAVVGGHPVTVNPVPLLTGRRVEVIATAFNPWMQDWWRRYKLEVNRALDTAYAATDAQVRRGCTAAGATHLLVDHERFSPDHATRPGELDWEPMASHVRELASSPPFALQQRVPPRHVCLLDCGSLEGPCWPVEPLAPPSEPPAR
jgi:hypothetical protein